MSRYINYDAIDYRNDRLHDKSEEFLNGVIYMAQRIEDAPSIDIVRCQDCKYWHKNRKKGDGMNVFDVCYDFQADDFCSYGERKETDHE